MCVHLFSLDGEFLLFKPVKGTHLFNPANFESYLMETTQQQRLQLKGISDAMKEGLKISSRELFGNENVSALVRKLISDHLAKTKNASPMQLGFAVNEPMKRVEIRLPQSVFLALERRAELRFSNRNYYLKTLLYADLDCPQLQGDEIETLRKSNYELSKIGGNINQIARAFNTLVAAGGNEKLPEIGKKMASLRKEIKTHTGKVLAVLEAKTTLFENKGQLGRVKPAKRQR